MQRENEIRILFNQEMVELWREEYFRRYPSRKKFDIKATCMSLNEFTAKVRLTQADYKVKYAEFVQFVLEYNNIPKLGLTDCHLEVIWTWKDKRRRDYDNYCITLKWFLDPIVKFGTLEDDSYLIMDGVDLRMKVDKSLEESQVEFIFTY